MTDPHVIYKDAAEERGDARKRVSALYDEEVKAARRHLHEGMEDTVRVYKLRVSQTRNPDCHLCSLDEVQRRWQCACNYKCPSTFCKGEE
jgi:hypothetical protein